MTNTTKRFPKQSIKAVQAKCGHAGKTIELADGTKVCTCCELVWK